MANNKFFTNTYITSRGRQNYLRIDELEDPLFTSFTFDIDYVTSPLFYTINYIDYGYPNVDGMSQKIENALSEMYNAYMSLDQGYDILPTLSHYILDDNKLGFGLQQNVYMDMPLYGATEYIYMVDKRNGDGSQNDVREDNNIFTTGGGNPNAANSYSLGDSVKSIVNESDKQWVEAKKEQCTQQIKKCQDVLSDENVKKQHEENIEAEKNAFNVCTAIKEIVKDENGNIVEYDEEGLQKKVNEYKKINEEFEQLKRDIVSWVNNNLSKYKNNGTNIYVDNKCVQRIYSYNVSDINDEKKKEEYITQLSTLFGDEFRKEKLFGNNNESYVFKFKKLYNEFINNKSIDWNTNNENSFLVEQNGKSIIRQSEIINQFSNSLKKFDLYKDSGKTFNGDIIVSYSATPPDWVNKSESHLDKFNKDGDNLSSVYKAINNIMSAQCDKDTPFSEEFTSEKIKNNEKLLVDYETALNNIKNSLYGMKDNVVCDSSNPTPDSPYGVYLSSKEKLENDEFTQAEKAYQISLSGERESTTMLDNYNRDMEELSDIKQMSADTQPLVVNKNIPTVAPQTVLDMLGFISGMKKMTMEYPYIMKSISGLDIAYNKHYGIKDPYLGSGDDKITLTCIESLDLRVSSMFNRYFNAVYDRQYRRERVPVNLRRFNCSIYVHDVRNFISKMRVGSILENRILELTDMYFGVIEFRFYDCEIVPEETGNIFNDISNEAPSEMIKTNFTFTYGNCVVNFVPPSEVANHNIEIKNDKNKTDTNK